MPALDSTRILIRATRLDARVREFADTVAAASGHRVSFLLDERKGRAADDGTSIVGLTDEKCRGLGLFLPRDYAWRCGDYGYYLARQQYPQAGFIWMIEFDVRFTGDRIADFFADIATKADVDFIATALMPADSDWYWTRTCLGRGVRPYRCLFPITRLSARAIDALLDRRRAQSRRFGRRALWPNDEAMVATTLANGDFVCRDFNDFDRPYYDAASFTFVEPIDGDALVPTSGPVRLLHPVLFGDAFVAKKNRLRAVDPPESRYERTVRRTLQRLNRMSRW